MLKWIGGLLTMSCSVWIGMNGLIRSRQRVRALRSLMEVLERMRLRLLEQYSPMPELLDGLSHSGAQPAAEFLSAVVYSLNRRHMPLAAAWELAVKDTEALFLLPEEERVLQALGGVLGRCSAEEQGEALLRTEKRLEVFLELEEKERMKQGKISAALGTGAGIMLVILLL